MPRTEATTASRWCATARALHAHPLADELDGKAPAKSVARLRYRMGLQLSGELAIRCWRFNSWRRRARGVSRSRFACPLPRDSVQREPHVTPPDQAGLANDGAPRRLHAVEPVPTPIGGDLDDVRRALRNPAVAQALAQRLLSGSAAAELAHLVLAALIAGILFHVVPVSYLAAWGAAVVAAVAGRTWWRLRALRGDYSAPRIQRGIRDWVALSGTVWGLGAWWVSAHAPFALIALVLVVLAGMVAGALVTLMPDRSAFLILTGLLLVPPAIGILATSTDHDHVSAAILIVVFGGFEAIVHQRAHRTLVEHVLTKVRAVRQHQELQESLGRVKLLSGLLPICAGCKKIRDAEGVWYEVEVYVRERSEAEFSHGLCPDCVERYSS